MEILVKATDNASGALNDIGKSTQNLEKSASGLSVTMNAALGALAAYAGSQGLKGVIGASEEASLTLSQARFFLAGFKGDVGKNLDTLKTWAAGMQKAGIAGDEYATLVAAKLTPRVKSLSKAQEYGNLLLRGERLGILNASEAANMMIRATEGNERAMRFLLEQMGIAAPQFVSLQTLFEELRRRIEEGEQGMTPFAIAMRRLKEAMGDFAENAGTPLANFFAFFINGINNMLDKFPALGTAITGAVAMISVALAGLGVGFAFDSLLKLVGLATSFGPWGLAIGAAIGLAVFYLSQLGSMSEQAKSRMIVAFTALAIALTAIMAATGSAFFIPFILALAALGVATSMSIEGYQISWSGFAQYLKDTFVGVGIILKEIWGATITWLKDQFTAFEDWISNKVTAVMDSVSRAISAVKSLPGTVVNAASNAVANISGGARAGGGPVTAGASYLVGENGPEIFTPRGAGSIIPNGGGSGVMVDMRGSMFLDRQVAVQIGDEIIKRLRELHRISAV
jgi:hypothetical protein